MNTSSHRPTTRPTTRSTTRSTRPAHVDLPAPDGRRVNRRILALALLTSTASLGMMACDDESANPPRQDVDTGLSCFVEDGHVGASGEITNHSSKSSFYILDIDFRLNGETVDHRGTSVDDVQPGETTHFEVVSDEGNDDITCHITNVERFKA